MRVRTGYEVEDDDDRIIKQWGSSPALGNTRTNSVSPINGNTVELEEKQACHRAPQRSNLLVGWKARYSPLGGGGAEAEVPNLEFPHLGECIA